jgi:hypothetical protein
MGEAYSKPAPLKIEGCGTRLTLNRTLYSVEGADAVNQSGPRGPPSLTTNPALTRLTANLPEQYYAGPMWGRIIRIVAIALLAIIVVSVVSPWFDLHPTTLRAFKRAITHFSLAPPPFLPSASSVLPTFLTMLPAPQSHQVSDIVARDCARLC